MLLNNNLCYHTACLYATTQHAVTLTQHSMLPHNTSSRYHTKRLYPNTQHAIAQHAVTLSYNMPSRFSITGCGGSTQNAIRHANTHHTFINAITQHAVTISHNTPSCYHTTHLFDK